MSTTLTQPSPTKLPKSPSKKKILKYADYVRLTPPDSGNYELHEGKIIFMPTPSPLHQIVSANLLVAIHNFIKKNQLGRVFAAPMDTVFTPTDVLQPDLLFLSKERLHLIGDKKIEGAPDLVVEILSPSNSSRAMSYKKFVYEVCDVNEYWVIHLEKKTITQYIKIENELFPHKIFQATDTLTSTVLKGFELSVEEIFG